MEKMCVLKRKTSRISETVRDKTLVAIRPNHKSHKACPMR